MKANAPKTPAAPRRPKKRPAHRCRRCPFCGPWGECLDRRLKSGRCGDWVWSVREGKQQRRLYVKPRDPRTPSQRAWRAQFGSASKRYSHSLTEEQREARIAAGAKLRSRPRLGQSGPLTGQQYSIRSDYAARGAERGLIGKSSENGLQTQGMPRSTSGIRRGMAGGSPGEHPRRRGPRPKGEVSGGHKAGADSGLGQRRSITRSACPRPRRASPARRRHILRLAARPRVFGRPAVLPPPPRAIPGREPAPPRLPGRLGAGHQLRRAKRELTPRRQDAKGVEEVVPGLPKRTLESLRLCVSPVRALTLPGATLSVGVWRKRARSGGAKR